MAHRLIIFAPERFMHFFPALLGPTRGGQSCVSRIEALYALFSGSWAHVPKMVPRIIQHGHLYISVYIYI